MTNRDFDEDEAKKFLANYENQEKNARELERQRLLDLTVEVLKKELTESGVEVYLVGSLLRPFAFSPLSDVDIVLKNYVGDRFSLWATLEKKLGRKVEIIPFETCSFQEFVITQGLKIL